MTEGPGPFELDHKARFGTITGSVVRSVTDRNDLSALISIFQLPRIRDPAKQAMMDRGHKEEENTAVFYIKEREKRESTEIRLVHPRFRRHALYPFLGASADRQVKDKNEGVQLKFRSGSRSSQPVDIHAKGCDRGASCTCHTRCEYIDQCCLEMWVYDWVRNDLAVRSDVNGDYVRIDRRCCDSLWLPIAWPIIQDFYDKYLKWYWTNDHSPESTDAARKLLREYVDDPKNAALGIDLESRVFSRRPEDFLLIKKSTELENPKGTLVLKRRFEGNGDTPLLPTDPACRTAASAFYGLSMPLLDLISRYAGADVSVAMPENSRYWKESMRSQLGLSVDQTVEPPDLLALTAMKLLGIDRERKAGAMLFTRLLEEASPRAIVMAAEGKQSLPFCVHGEIQSFRMNPGERVPSFAPCVCKKGTAAGASSGPVTTPPSGHPPNTRKPK